MTEYIKQSNEQERNSAEHISEVEALRNKIEAETTSNAEKAQGTVTVEQAARRVEQLAVSSQERSRAEHTPRQQHHPVMIGRHLKEMAYSRSMTRIRKQLSVPSRLFSKAVHSKVLDRPSEVIGNTVARPSGMLGGALFAAFGTSTLLWITKRFGYEYNYLAVVILFIIGLVVGVSLEFIYKALKKR